MLGLVLPDPSPVLVLLFCNGMLNACASEGGRSGVVRDTMSFVFRCSSWLPGCSMCCGALSMRLEKRLQPVSYTLGRSGCPGNDYTSQTSDATTSSA